MITPLLRLVVFDLDFCVWHPEMYQIRGPPVLANLRALTQQHTNKTPRKRKKSGKGTTKGTAKALPTKPTTNRKGMIVTDRDGTPITVFEGASHALSELNRWKSATTTTTTTTTTATKGNSKSKSKSKPTSVVGVDAVAPPTTTTTTTTIRTAVASCTDKPSFARLCMDWLVVDDGSTLASCFDHVEIRPGDKQQHFASLHRITGIPYHEMCFFDDYDANIDSVGALGVHCFHTPRGMTTEIWEEAMEHFGIVAAAAAAHGGSAEWK